MSQEKIILKLAQYYWEQRKSSAMDSIKRTLKQWGLFYFALLFLFVAFIGFCLSAYLWLEPVLGDLNAALCITLTVAALGVLCILAGKLIGRRQQKSKVALPPEFAEICEQVSCDVDLKKFLSKHGLKILAGFFLLGLLSSKCGRK